jgi:hypothetical protein
MNSDEKINEIKKVMLERAFAFEKTAKIATILNMQEPKYETGERLKCRNI